MIPVRPWWRNSCAFYTLRTRLRVRWAPGIPHALFGRRIHAQLGRNASRECGGVSCRHREPTGRANARPMTGSAKQSILSSRPHGLLRRFALRNDDPQSPLCLEITSPACGGGRRAKQRNCAPERDGWGKTYLLERRALWRHPHPNPPPQAARKRPASGPQAGERRRIHSCFLVPSWIASSLRSLAQTLRVCRRQ